MTAPAINNSATPPALLHYIPDHLLKTGNRDHYETVRTLCEIKVRGVDLGIENHITNKSLPPAIRVQAEYAQYMSAQAARAVALALLQLADVVDEEQQLRAPKGVPA